MSRLTLAMALAGAGCGGEAPAPKADAGTIVDVVAQGLTFQAPDTVPAGWITIRLHNASQVVHFALVERMPEGIGIREQQADAAPIFQEGMDLLNAGETDEAMARFGELPEWFGEVTFLGGPGLTAPGHTSEASIHLEPGTYLLECYVKTAGTFHSFNPDPNAYGMVHQFTVIGPLSSEPEPTAVLRVTLSTTRGIEIEGTPIVGRQTVAVTFEDQAVYQNFAGHDVHLVHLNEDTDLGALAAWMDWTQETGLQTPAPAEFVGGLNELPAGATGYLTVTLEPGRYAWIAEVPHPDSKGLLKVFTVSSETAGGG